MITIMLLKLLFSSYMEVMLGNTFFFIFLSCMRIVENFSDIKKKGFQIQSATPPHNAQAEYNLPVFFKCHDFHDTYSRKNKRVFSFSQENDRNQTPYSFTSMKVTGQFEHKPYK